MYRTLKFVLSSALLAAPAIAVGQATQPSNVVDVTPLQSSAPASKPTVLLLPVAAPAGSYSWVGRAIQQDVEVDLAQMGIARVIAPASGPQADDSEAALRAARDAGATHVVFARAQVSGNQLRVTGQVLNVSDGKSLAAIKMTAPADNLFPLEDGISVQIAHALPGGPEALASAAKAQNDQGNQQPKQSMPTVIYGQPSSSAPAEAPAPQYYSTSPPSDYSAPYTTNTYVYTDPYYYGYGYPYYGYGYYPFGIYYGGFGFFGGNFHNRFHDGGHFRGGFHDGDGFRGGFGGGFHGGGGSHGSGHGGGHR